jgi:hypothetical protein
MNQAQKAYSNLLEDATGYTIESARDDDGDKCFYLIDACGDRSGDPWYDFRDLFLETEEVIDATDRDELILVAADLIFAA